MKVLRLYFLWNKTTGSLDCLNLVAPYILSLYCSTATRFEQSIFIKMKFEPNTFILVPNKQHLKGLNSYAQLVFIWICAHANFGPDHDGYCFPSRRRIAECCGIAKSTVDKSIKILEEEGLIEKEQRKSDHGDFTSNKYYVQIKE